ncbi:MAG: hypothetical protein HWN66_14775 [Candidatus Helarchaeota archaeon]|nr:hypothetical protein [Candidatus Helarchaeota archaeon]
MNEPERKLVIRFSQADRIKASILNMMQIFLKFQDYLEHKKEEPDGKTVLSWFLNLLFNDTARAANISQSQNLIEAQNLLSEIIAEFGVGSHPNFQRLMDSLRNTIIKITSEASYAAKELKF